MHHEGRTSTNPHPPVLTPTSEDSLPQFAEERVVDPPSMSDRETTERQTPTVEPAASTASSTVATNSATATPATKDDVTPPTEEVVTKAETAKVSATTTTTKAGQKKAACKKHKHKRVKKQDQNKKNKNKKRHAKEESSSSDDTASDSDSSTSSSSEESDSLDDTAEFSESDSESEKQKRRRRKAKNAKKARRRRRSHREEETSDYDSANSSDEDDVADQKALKRLRRRKAKKLAKKWQSDSEEEDDTSESEEIESRKRVAGSRSKQAASRRRLKEKTSGKKAKSKRASKVAFKRVDELWDSTIHNYKLQETMDDPDADEFDQYVFTVRRKFDWENKYMETVVDIKSKFLKEALVTVMDGVKSVSLVTDVPVVDPNMLFLYLEEARAHMKVLKKLAKTEKKKKSRKLAATKAAHLKILIKYLDTDYAETKKTLYPLLESNMITFDLLWALFKPNTIAYTPTYGHADEPRAFKIEYATKESSFMKGTWYVVEGKYLEYDGKTFGMGNMAADVESFKGVRKISSLACYPLKYHREADNLKAKLVERGKKFVSLHGMNYRFHKGMAFFKKKRSVIKVNINGRVMIDPALHRRINPNYPISTVKAKDPNLLDSDSDGDSDDCCCCASSSDEAHGDANDNDSEPSRPRYKLVRDNKGKAHLVEVEYDENGQEVPPKENLDNIDKDNKNEDSGPEFTDEELLIASPVVLGFAFSEKLWLEFSVSGVRDIEWNEGAFDSLVLPDNQKSIVKALVESHSYHAAENIDDVIQGKGKGLVAVLHGPPGTGKTLTAEGIAELLKRPLYMVSAGELGTDSRSLEGELNKILDIAHSWGAVLLLDEADVFLEKRTIQDIHRNALVSIFLRLLEYFQGILFLTTNRVETFDDAFQSRIHIALRYGDLTTKAKRAVWKMFLDKVKSIDGVETAEFTDKDLDVLARHNLNGRQIKNSVRTAQALAVNEKSALSMSHIKRVLEVAETFEQDLKGGTGYMDAMRSYT
ncbi:hypothetical protein PISL3812_06050 [Talaromyces islandicus]|uniref:AAA+ ATPase domain-containing protein n=1 Tax=Talaromyces islandicus TaxID=28573 RepID=A0A0U1M0D0_TALIS|nr:hypothetical protein PISL3812_06050 [Talaromyces islandicus]